MLVVIQSMASLHVVIAIMCAGGPRTLRACNLCHQWMLQTRLEQRALERDHREQEKCYRHPLC